MKNQNVAKTQNKSFLCASTNSLAWTVALTTAVTITPALLAHTPNNQIITGSIVNALLFVAAFKLPLLNTLIIAIVPSSIALLRGLLPAPMALLMPYIMISNLILIASFKSLKNLPAVGVMTASLSKFAFLYLIAFIFAERLNSSLIIMFQWPQLLTALIGGFTAINIIKIFQTNDQV